MKIHAHMYKQQDEDSLVAELENEITPYIDAFRDFESSLSSAGFSTRSNEDLNREVISSQKEYLWLSGLVKEKSDHEAIVHDTPDLNELTLLTDNLQELSNSISSIYQEISDDTLRKPEAPESTTNYV